MMKDQNPQHVDRLSAPPEHYSYLKHRKQRAAQIFLPVIVSTLMLVGLIVLISISTFKSGGDVGRWAAISTMWIIIPILVAGLIVLAILVGLIYLMMRLLNILPHYTGITQDYVSLASAYIIRAADMVSQPVIAIEGIVTTVKEFFGRINDL
jgi:hypothetical protein